MSPASPVFPDIPNLPEVVYAKNQPEYMPLPVVKQADGCVTSRWRLSWKERICVLFRGNVYLQTLTFNRPLQPVSVSVDPPGIRCGVVGEFADLTKSEATT